MNKQIIDHGFGIIETRETFYTEETISKFNQQIAELEKQLEEKEKESKALKDVRTLERVIPRESQLHNLSNKECYLKGFENGVSESIRTFEYSYGEDKSKIIEERDKYFSDIYKVGGYKSQIESLQAQLHTQPKEIVEKIGGEIYTRMVVECKETKYTDINLILNTILKEYGEKNDSRRTKSRSKETRLQHYQNTRES